MRNPFHRVTFRAGRNTVSFLSNGRAGKKVRAARKARGRAMARKYGFVKRSGKVYRRDGYGGLILVPRSTLLRNLAKARRARLAKLRSRL
jgi:hypothetical protein